MLIEDNLSVEQYWRFNKNHSVGLFTDMNLYYEALYIAITKGFINVNLLEKNLLQRVIGLKYIDTFKKSAFQGLLRELNKFKLVYKEGNDFYNTQSGLSLYQLYKISIEKYHDVLLERMNREYGIPGWFIYRLWSINPKGQGQIVVPSPIKTWKPVKRKWNENAWIEELKNVAEETYFQINRKLPGSFPMPMDRWISSLKIEYERLGKRKQRRVSKNLTPDTDRKLEFFSPRARLTLAMKDVAVNFLFANKYLTNANNDFIPTKINRLPINSRTFMVWCPRLETFELIYYSDYFLDIPGRVIFPCSVFSPEGIMNNFEPLNFINSPKKEILFKHKPEYSFFQAEFINTLNECYQTIYNREGIIYVSLQEVRDMVCRLLRISAARFERFLELSFRASVKREINIAIALETDIREDQQSGSQIQRRPVFINNIPHSLIAVKKFN